MMTEMTLMKKRERKVMRRRALKRAIRNGSARRYANADPVYSAPVIPEESMINRRVEIAQTVAGAHKAKASAFDAIKNSMRGIFGQRRTGG